MYSSGSSLPSAREKTAYSNIVGIPVIWNYSRAFIQFARRSQQIQRIYSRKEILHTSLNETLFDLFL